MKDLTKEEYKQVLREFIKEVQAIAIENIDNDHILNNPVEQILDAIDEYHLDMDDCFDD